MEPKKVKNIEIEDFDWDEIIEEEELAWDEDGNLSDDWKSALKAIEEFNKKSGKMN